MKFVITPNVGAGPIKFGMTRNEVRQVINLPAREYEGGHTLPSDSFRGSGVAIHYREPDSCEVIALSLPANPIFRNRSLLKGQSLQVLNLWLKSIDDSVVNDICGITAYELGIALYTPDYDLFKFMRPEDALISAPGYYKLPR